MPDRHRYYAIRDQIGKWTAVYDGLRREGRYWLADRLRNAVESSGVGIAGALWFDRDAYEGDRALIASINGLPGNPVRIDTPAPGDYPMDRWPPGLFYFGGFNA